MTASEDTEITLGTGKMLGLFFGLVIVCALFFAFGFSLGNSTAARTTALTSDPAAALQASGAGERPSASRGASSPAVSEADNRETTSPAEPASTADSSPESQPESTPAVQQVVAKVPAATESSASQYFVQVAAVSKQEDAQALVGALKNRQYAAFAANSSVSDKLYHVQIGPFSDLKEAESTRASLIKDGYNPILKK